jgi:hypothetical protein
VAGTLMRKDIKVLALGGVSSKNADDTADPELPTGC